MILINIKSLNAAILPSQTAAGDVNCIHSLPFLLHEMCAAATRAFDCSPWVAATMYEPALIFKHPQPAREVDGDRRHQTWRWHAKLFGHNSPLPACRSPTSVRPSSRLQQQPCCNQGRTWDSFTCELPGLAMRPCEGCRGTWNKCRRRRAQRGLADGNVLSRENHLLGAYLKDFRPVRCRGHGADNCCCRRNGGAERTP